MYKIQRHLLEGVFGTISEVILLGDSDFSWFASEISMHMFFYDLFE